MYRNAYLNSISTDPIPHTTYQKTELPNYEKLYYENSCVCENLASLKSLGNITQKKKQKRKKRQGEINMQQSLLSYNYAVD